MQKPRPTLNVAHPFGHHSATTRQHSDFDIANRQESVLRPGEVWTPGVRPTPLADWAQGDSTLWETKEGSTANNTPLAGYGRGDLWTAGDHRDETDDDDEEARRQAVTTAMFAVEAARAATPSPESSMGPYHVSGTYTSQQHVFGSSAAVGFGSNRQTPSSTTPNALSRQTSETLLARMRSMDSEYLMNKYRSQSEILSDQLFFLAQMFPPPPPPSVPMETRRSRAELWYSIARKWDLTQRLPPPPRSPLPGMEEEHRLRLQELTRVPYRGDRWLAQSERWFHYVQDDVFRYPADNTPLPLDADVVLSLIA